VSATRARALTNWPAVSDAAGESMLDTRAREVRDSVREIAAAEIAPRAAKIDADSRFPAEGLAALADAGLTGLLVPQRFGGTGDSMLAYVAAMEEISAACGATSTVYMTQMHAAHPILLAGEEAQQERWLPGLATAQLLGSLAVTEPEAGSDLSGMRTRASRDGEDYVLDGTKTFITTGDRADLVVLFSTVAGTNAREGATSFVIERGMPGFSPGGVLAKMGQKGSSTAELFLERCRVPAANRLGPEGTAYALSLRSVTMSRASAAAQGVGFARAAFEGALAWAAAEGLLASRRRDAQDVQFLLAELRARVAAARALLRSTAALIDSGSGDAAASVSIAKLICTDTAMEVAGSALSLMGEDGDRVDLGVERVWRDAKVTQIYDGTNQVQRMLIARDTRRAMEAPS
jgi:alkylation response protein AidB-like acyl-CoA dehydrogenase